MNASKELRYEPGRGPRDRSLRVGDKERDAVSLILREAHGEGRLDEDEFQARLDRCLRAKTYADLDRLIADVPRGGGDVARTRPRFPGPRLGPVPFVFLPVVVLIAAVGIGAHVAWLAFPLIFFFVVRPLMWRAWGHGPMWPRRVP